MKRLILNIFPVLICGMMLASCESYFEIEKEGAYSGTFKISYLSSSKYTVDGPISIILENGKYTCLGIPHEQANISGTYKINSNKILIEINVWETDFIDENGSIICFDFDINIIPQGECNYKFDGKKLKLSKLVESYANYEWNLEKQ